jgi:hypothetical protein
MTQLLIAISAWCMGYNGSTSHIDSSKCMREKLLCVLPKVKTENTAEFHLRQSAEVKIAEECFK